MDVLYSGVKWAFSEVIWVVWTDTCMHKTVVVPYVIKVFDGFIAMQPLGELYDAHEFIQEGLPNRSVRRTMPE